LNGAVVDDPLGRTVSTVGRLLGRDVSRETSIESVV
jgi:hypothetical protein